MLQNHIKSNSAVCHGKIGQRKSIIPNKVFLCEKCGEQFSSKDLLKTHSESHMDNKSRTKTKPSEFKCDLCLKKFTQCKNYERHKRQAFDDDEKPRNICDLCGKSFCTSRLLKRHNNESHQVTCPTCDEIFTTKRARDIHIQRRESVTCVECNKIFCNKQAYSVHVSYTHTKFA